MVRLATECRALLLWCDAKGMGGPAFCLLEAAILSCNPGIANMGCKCCHCHPHALHPRQPLFPRHAGKKTSGSSAQYATDNGLNLTCTAQFTCSLRLKLEGRQILSPAGEQGPRGGLEHFSPGWHTRTSFLDRCEEPQGMWLDSKTSYGLQQAH